MGYKPRIEVPFGYYHVVTRGNNRRSIFADDRDRELFLLFVRHVARRYGWSFLAYCLMTNHYHFVLQLGERGISRGMCELNTGYAVTHNLRHDRINHLFGRRFWSELIASDSQLLATCRYVVQNPVRAGLCGTCADWSWSSYRATIGLALPEPFLAVKDVLVKVMPGANDPTVSFRDFCETIVPARVLRSAGTPAPSRPPAASAVRPSR